MRCLVTRFLITALLAAIAAVVVATLILPIAAFFGTEAINGAAQGYGVIGGQMAQVFATLGLLLVAIPIGCMVALPCSLVMGGVMVWLTARWPHLDRWPVWIGAAGLASLPANLIVGGAYDMYPDRINLALWMALAAIVGAILFRWRWQKKR